LKFEYLLLNFLILAGPLCMSFEKQVRFVRNWRHALPAIALVALPFLVWDALVTGRHWRFNPDYTLAARIAGLPLEECLFFFTVPFAALFMWETIKFYLPFKHSAGLQYAGYILLLGAVRGLVLVYHGKEYTGLVLIALACAALLDILLETKLFSQTRLLVFLAALFVVTCIFNGYLTARPVVLYEEQYQLGVRLGTIPIEDFGYGIALVLLTTSVYEKLKARARPKADE
jgi:lycopene cyclase domain-containing protein